MKTARLGEFVLECTRSVICRCHGKQRCERGAATDLQGLRFEQVAARVTNPELVVKAGITSALGNVAFRMGRRFLRRPISQVNSKVLGPLALGVKL